MHGDDPLTDRTLRTLAPLMHHILTRVGGIRARRLEPTRGGRELQIPINQDAFDDANRLWATLVTSTQIVADDTGATPPGVIRNAWRDAGGKPIGLPAGTTPDDGYEHTSTVSRWLEHQAPEGYLTPIVWAAQEISPRHPLRDRPRTTSDAVCEDDRGRLVVKPARHYLDEEIAVCETCGRVYGEAELARTTVLWAAVQARERVEARADAVRRHLAAKYGRVE